MCPSLFEIINLINMKKTLKIQRLVDETIKVGDVVRLFDGSALSCDKEPDQDIYVVYSYPELTGLSEPIKELDAVVLEVALSDFVLPFQPCDIAYLQDITIQIGTGIFRTASKLVEKVETGIEYTQFEEL